MSPMICTYLKIDLCEYDKDEDKERWIPAVKNELTRDQFGLCDDALKEQLLCETDLTLYRELSQ